MAVERSSLQEDLETITRQEKMLEFRAFDETAAWELGCRVREACAKEAHPVVIEVRRFGQPLFFSALAGTTPDNVDWVRRKANTVERFHRSSYGMGLELQAKGVTLEERFGLTLKEYAAHGGGFPLRVAQVGVIGSVTISGLPQRQDHELVVQILCQVLGQNYEVLRLR